MRLTATLISLLCLASAADIKTVLLNECCGISAENISRLDRGEALGKLVETGDDRDLALMGAVRLTIPKQVSSSYSLQTKNGYVHIPSSPLTLY